MSQKLGSGEFGVVHLGTWTDGSADPIQVAVKTLNSKYSESDKVKFQPLWVSLSVQAILYMELWLKIE